MILTAIALMLAAQEPSAQPMLVPADGKKHKLQHNGETFEVRNFGDKITVYHIPTIFGRKRGSIVRDWNRQVARLTSGCDIDDEYVDPFSLQLQANLICHPVASGAKG